MGGGFKLAESSLLPTPMYVCIFLYTLLRFFFIFLSFHHFRLLQITMLFSSVDLYKAIRNVLYSRKQVVPQRYN